MKLGFTLLQTLPGGRAIDLVKKLRWQLCPRDEPTEEPVDGCLEVGPTSKDKQTHLPREGVVRLLKAT